MAVALAVAVLVGACRSDDGGGDDAATTTTTTTPLQFGTPPDEPPPPPIRPTCELLTRQQVGSALGNAVQQGSGSGKDCFWATDVDGGTSVNLTVIKPGRARAAEECELLRNGLPDGPPHEQVPGLAPSAVWVTEPVSILRQGHLLACWEDSAVLVVLTGEKDAGALRATAIDLAKTVHGRI